jgi:hypothetical protein
MRRFLLAALLAGVALSAFALPTVDEVQAEVAKGNYAHAETMMREVVESKPGSARAHYVYAEILAHDRRFDLASAQLARAKAIDPSLAFTQPEKFRAFEQLLEREQAAAQRSLTSPVPTRSGPLQAPPADRGGVPGWVWGLGLAAVGLVAWKALSKRGASGPATPAYAGTAGQGLPPASQVGGFGQTPLGAGTQAPAAGSGLLRTGLAVAGGVAAGMLAEKLLSEHTPSSAGTLFPEASRGLGSQSFNEDGNADPARELAERPVDFGNGDGWGESDAGGGSSDGGWD